MKEGENGVFDEVDYTVGNAPPRGDADNGEEQHSVRWTGIDTLIAIFFCVAAMWLIAATIYSVILLILIRLQARGELDIYDENLGRWSMCNGRFTLHFGCILRRYAIQLERDYQRRLQQRYGTSDGSSRAEEPAPIRIMTREERRKAMEELLGIKIDIPAVCEGENKLEPSGNDNQSKLGTMPSSPNASVDSSNEGPICSICLAEYENADSVFKSTSCPHMYHKECLMEWLERRNNTECPCCRDPLVSDEKVWETVQRMRKERRKQLRKENGLTHRFIQWALSKRRDSRQASMGDRNSTNSMSSTSADEDPESQQGNSIEECSANQAGSTTSTESTTEDKSGQDEQEASCVENNGSGDNKTVDDASDSV